MQLLLLSILLKHKPCRLCLSLLSEPHNGNHDLGLWQRQEQQDHSLDSMALAFVAN
jgi:hypothetical protein